MNVFKKPVCMTRAAVTRLLNTKVRYAESGIPKTVATSYYFLVFVVNSSSPPGVDNTDPL